MFEGKPENCGFGKVHHAGFGSGLLSIRDSEMVAYLVKAGVEYPTIFSLVWGTPYGHVKLFPKALRDAAFNIEECVKKREAAFDAQEHKIQSIILDLLQLLYEKQVNDIVEKILK